MDGCLCIVPRICRPRKPCVTKRSIFPPLDIISPKRSLVVSDPKTRRFFLGALTAASAVRVWGANEKVNVGIVGLGGRGTSHLNTYTGLEEAQVVGLCDVNQA